MMKNRKYIDSVVIANTKDMSREEWLKWRQIGIGGSDASCIAGMNPWRTPVQIYIDKKSDNPNNETSYRMELGNKLEDFVAREFAEQTGKKVRVLNGILKNDKYPFAMANIDRCIVGEKAFLECKVTNSYAKKEWEEGVPLHYEIQCLHYMAITGATHCYIAALVGNADFIWHKIERDEETISNLMAIEKEFWEEYIEKDIIPEPDGSAEYSSYLKDKYKDAVSTEIELEVEDSIMSRYDQVSGLIKELELEKKTIEQQIQDKMGANEVAKVGNRKITWKVSTRNTIDSKLMKQEIPDIVKKYTKTTSSRTLRVGGLK
ncbi:MAG: YqaJ viral recombinase family protein [Peptostreptococcaceae bacterium]